MEHNKAKTLHFPGVVKSSRYVDNVTFVLVEMLSFSFNGGGHFLLVRLINFLTFNFTLPT